MKMGNLRSEVKKDFHKLENRFDVSYSTLRNKIDVLIDSLAIRFINDVPRKKKNSRLKSIHQWSRLESIELLKN
ncbi:conserved hypothetical protein [Leptospira interrogans serovar Manilae]|uniref:Uncharacterized protein n=2 Tax=Leptospira interrogans TaxID=173 RepID=A0AAQ1SNE7_LEPIR|nr:hypothetical protein [Leptospira interrogans]EMJ57542.1 hypothetical protein LEP1GSC013_2271 [Leptospira interrogans serovar Valbuzzi str. Duyster]ENO70987.1 hypothetical protein LEP1GSC012_1168 [Leptospira interrogans serovar Valbuzzi str. Valbuzzi]AKP26159.1 hypothetical protein LIMLP_09535 [Leptospira interrogans serovar Manilae]AKP29944.1 hypothetical protein LIMHP_09540 [Leptospira interrogans serovar Manilae]EYU63357.1 hypothetical protein CI00_14640 [Leptospira interrogans serovar Ma